MLAKGMQPVKVTLVRSRAIDPAVNKLAETLSENEYDVKLLLWDRQNTLKAKNVHGYTICKFTLKAPYDKFTVLFYLPIWWIYEFVFLLKDKANIIHACDLDTLVPAILAKLIKRVKLCYTIYDFYANNLPDGHFQLIRKLIRSVTARVERLGIGFTDGLFLADEFRYEDVRGARIKRIAYIHNSPPDHFEAKRGHESRERIEIAIFYAGVINKWRGLESMIKAVEGLDNVELTIAGLSSDTTLFKNQAADAKSKVQYIGWIPYEEVIRRTLEADILFAFYDPRFSSTKWADSSKLFAAMMCAKPIIVNEGTIVSKIVADEKCGLIIPYGDVSAISGAILKLKNNPELRRKLGEYGRKAYENRYSWDIMRNRLINVYCEVTESV